MELLEFGTPLNSVDVRNSIMSSPKIMPRSWNTSKGVAMQSQPSQQLKNPYSTRTQHPLRSWNSNNSGMPECQESPDSKKLRTPRNPGFPETLDFKSLIETRNSKKNGIPVIPGLQQCPPQRIPNLQVWNFKHPGTTTIPNDQVSTTISELIEFDLC
jgi:hypothetical protein